MVDDEMVTVPPLTKTPPPCKQRAKREFPIGALGTFEDERARTEPPAEFPLMVHNEMVTVPEET
jgi:hypothetical protein